MYVLGIQRSICICKKCMVSSSTLNVNNGFTRMCVVWRVFFNSSSQEVFDLKLTLGVRCSKSHGRWLFVSLVLCWVLVISGFYASNIGSTFCRWILKCVSRWLATKPLSIADVSFFSYRWHVLDMWHLGLNFIFHDVWLDPLFCSQGQWSKLRLLSWYSFLSMTNISVLTVPQAIILRKLDFPK